jgi:hypothetical protein
MYRRGECQQLIDAGTSNHPKWVIEVLAYCSSSCMRSSVSHLEAKIRLTSAKKWLHRPLALYREPGVCWCGERRHACREVGNVSNQFMSVHRARKHHHQHHHHQQRKRPTGIVKEARTCGNCSACAHASQPTMYASRHEKNCCRRAAKRTGKAPIWQSPTIVSRPPTNLYATTPSTCETWTTLYESHQHCNTDTCLQTFRGVGAWFTVWYSTVA